MTPNFGHKSTLEPRLKQLFQLLNILLKLGKHQFYSFQKSELEKYLSDDEKGVLSNFLAKMIKIGILNSKGVKNSGEYEFSNILYFTYFMIKANEGEVLT